MSEGYTARLRRTFAIMLRTGADLTTLADEQQPKIGGVDAWSPGVRLFGLWEGAAFPRIHPDDWRRLRREGWIEPYPKPGIVTYWRLTDAGRAAARDARRADNQKVAVRFRS